jgi:hypothetical protein
MQTYGFHFSHYIGGKKDPILREYTFKDTETLTKGDILNNESGEVDLAVSGDTGFIGVADETKAGTDSTTKIWVIWDAQGLGVYRVKDDNARTEGTELDISGTTGAMTVAADSDSDVIVVANSTATEPTLVRFHPRAYGFTAS